jgi:hypothetical protein
MGRGLTSTLLLVPLLLAACSREVPIAPSSQTAVPIGREPPRGERVPGSRVVRWTPPGPDWLPDEREILRGPVLEYARWRLEARHGHAEAAEQALWALARRDGAALCGLADPDEVEQLQFTPAGVQAILADALRAPETLLEAALHPVSVAYDAALYVGRPKDQREHEPPDFWIELFHTRGEEGEWRLNLSALLLTLCQRASTYTSPASGAAVLAPMWLDDTRQARPFSPEHGGQEHGGSESRTWTYGLEACRHGAARFEALAKKHEITGWQNYWREYLPLNVLVQNAGQDRLKLPR